MDEKIKLELQLASSMADSFREEEFYEEIEAPNFVDFTLPHHFCPDDRYWFCSRVGCDQRHEQEIDPDAISKNFVLRVMAARSPNVRLRKALSRRPDSETKKCPFSAPPKSSKSRLPRLALASSISKKLVLDGKSTNKPHPPEQKPCSTPKARVKHVAAKYMTSVRTKKVSSSNGFRSVRNTKRTSNTLPKTKAVAKVLAFNSPKKSHKMVKSSKELSATPITKLCEGLKKMKIIQNKGKASEELTATPITKLCEGMKKMKIINKSSKSRKNETKLCRSVKKAENVIQGAKTVEKLRDVVIDKKPGAEMKSKVESDTSEEVLGSSGCGSSKIVATGSENTQTTEVISFTDSEDRIFAKEEDDQGKTRSDISCDGDIENQNPRLVEELTNKDGKIISENISNMKGGSIRNHDAPVKRKIKNMDKSSKENCSTAMQGKLLYKKLKPTNPKPFRLRTDERGILKEATLERKANSNDNASENLQSGHELPENREKQRKKEMDKSFKQDKIRAVKSKYLSTSKVAEPKPDRVPASCSEKSTNNPQREKALRVKCGLSAVEESKARILKPRVNPGKIVTNPTSKAHVVTHKLAAQGKRAEATILPREPNFQSLRKPRVCKENKE